MTPLNHPIPKGARLQYARPSTLRAGQRVFLCVTEGGVPQLTPATVAWRDGAVYGRYARTTVQVPIYAGLNGPADPGHVHLDDGQVRRLLVLCSRDGQPMEARA